MKIRPLESVCYVAVTGWYGAATVAWVGTISLTEMFGDLKCLFDW